MTNPLFGKRALVTGASKGIGFAIARAFAENGANVVICARQQTSLDNAVSELRKTAKGKVSGYVADVSRSADIARLFEFTDKELGGLDILVNNAGVGIFHSAAEMTIGETPPRVVIQEAVTLAERFGSAASAKFVNGVLDALARRMGRM